VKPKVLTFEKALAMSPGGNKPHILLGNGFSRAWRDDIFSYGSLLDQAEFKDLSPSAKDSFEILDTTDFEAVMRSLKSAAALVGLYEPSADKLQKRMLKDAKGLREVLVKTIAARHPARPGRVSIKEYEHAKQFLCSFGHIYTLNYDLLLYWTLMQNQVKPEIKFDDGFRTPDDGPTDYVTWDVEKTNKQNVFYLHGALHIFDAGYETKKYTWINTGVPLIDQIREALENDLFPLFVSEAESKQKLARIKHSDILSRGMRSFSQIKGDLFIFGHSMSSNDEHIIRLIEKGGLSRLFIGLHGPIDNTGNKAIIGRARKAKKMRGDSRPIEIVYYDSESAEVWR
jgi:hypothetical protein